MYMYAAAYDSLIARSLASPPLNHIINRILSSTETMNATHMKYPYQVLITTSFP